MEQHFDLSSVKGEANLVVADVPDHTARDVGDQLAIDTCFLAARMLVAVENLEQRRLAAPLPGNYHFVGRHQRLAAESRVHRTLISDVELDIVGDERIQDRVRNLVGDLVGVPLGYGFAGEEIVRT